MRRTAAVILYLMIGFGISVAMDMRTREDGTIPKTIFRTVMWPSIVAAQSYLKWMPPGPKTGRVPAKDSEA